MKAPSNQKLKKTSKNEDDLKKGFHQSFKQLLILQIISGQVGLARLLSDYKAKSMQLTLQLPSVLSLSTI